MSFLNIFKKFGKNDKEKQHELSGKKIIITKNNDGWDVIIQKKVIDEYLIEVNDKVTKEGLKIPDNAINIMILQTAIRETSMVKDLAQIYLKRLVEKNETFKLYPSAKKILTGSLPPDWDVPFYCVKLYNNKQDALSKPLDPNYIDKGESVEKTNCLQLSNDMSSSVERALNSQEFIQLPLRQIKKFTEIGSQIFHFNHPEMSLDDAKLKVEHALVVSCPKCGEYSDEARNLVLLAGDNSTIDIAKGVIFGGSNSAAISSGKCPGCGSTELLATFYQPRLV